LIPPPTVRLHHYRHRAVATSDHRGTARGFLPRGLSNTCPQVCATRGTVASHGQVSNKPKHFRTSDQAGSSHANDRFQSAAALCRAASRGSFSEAVARGLEAPTASQRTDATGASAVRSAEQNCRAQGCDRASSASDRLERLQIPAVRHKHFKSSCHIASDGHRARITRQRSCAAA
jgi:hypothetical protein